MTISTIARTDTSPTQDAAGQQARQSGDRSFLAYLFGTGVFRRRGGPVSDDGPLGTLHPQGEAWAAALARGDQRKVGRRSPYPINQDIEALYASARAAGGAHVFDPLDHTDAAGGGNGASGRNG